MTAEGAAGGSALRRCIACGTDTFAEQYWGRRPLLSRATQLDGSFGELLDAAAVDELVSRRGLRTPFLRMAKDGSVLPRGRYTRGGGSGAAIDDQVAEDRVLDLLGDGATLVLQALHRTWPPLVGFATRLSTELGHPVQVNAYITPPQNQGFAAHYDVHDVFVLQVAGRKRWTIHEPVVPDPLSDQPWEDHRAEVVARAGGDDALLDTVLGPGDALYLPRGTVHAAAALGETSIHLTVGVHPLTLFQLVRHLLDTAADAAAQHPELRASLPMGADLADPAVLEPHLITAVAALRSHLDSDVTDEVARRVGVGLRRQTRPEPLAPLAQLAAEATLTPRTALRPRLGLRATVRADGTGITITTLDRTLRLCTGTADAVKAAFSGEPFTPAELPGLEPDDQLALARELLHAGMIVPE